MLKNFEKKYGVDIRLSTFNDADEALTKIASERLEFDLYFPSYDSLGPTGHRPTCSGRSTRTTCPTPPTCGRGFRDPWYDLGWLYTVPYTIYSTGIGWRTDRVPEDIAALDNPYDCFWDTDVRRRPGDPRRLAHGDGDGAAAQRARPTSTPTSRRHRGGARAAAGPARR